ncbi:LpqB family beta-propeller domain-containing protein [Luteimonas viscosa]|uniref:LpqB family beta-propeller domain-containing protein n=1 Tax=Luteimonas viscosa TaxID=1132694 RepID=UPI001654634B|nr:LpqB family beta-propeller domain-containing protein [Luteimonas viscosa]
MSEQTAIGKIDAGSVERPGRAGPVNFSAGEALVQPSLNRISIRGRVAQVEPKVMQVLVLMAERPGTVIARDTFLDTIWAGTVADDYLLNRAISELRKVFEDDPQTPRYIETIRKGGYRLVAPIAPARVAAALAPPAPEALSESAETAGTVQPAEPAVAGVPPPAQAAAQGGRPRATRLVLVLAAAAALGLAGWFLLPRAPSGPVGGPGGAYEIRPLTSFVGRELEPALSPDGSRVAFIRDGDGGFDVYVKTIGSEEVLNLTDSPVDERHPLWTADGRALLFARTDDGGLSVMRVSALGGGVTRVLHDDTMREIRGMSLSPDGTRIAYAAREAASEPYRIVLATLDGGERRTLSMPDAGTLGDTDPRFSHDSRTIVFVRGVNEVTRDVYRVRAEGGVATRLTFDNRKINGLAWSPDGERILFTSTRSGMYTLWSADPENGALETVGVGNEDIHQPATTPGVDAIAFEQWMHRSQLRQIELSAEADASAGAAHQLRSTRWDSSPAWSPDGERIAFASNRSGPHGVWISRRDGSGAVQVAAFDGMFVDNPAWSPDGRSIAFDASPGGRTAIFTVSPEGGTPQALVDGPGDNRNPAWSRDGAWLYFESNRSGEWRVHALPAGGGEAVAVTPGPGVHPRETVDGGQLLYSKPDQPGLWALPRVDWRDAARRTPETLLVADLDPRDGGNWAPADAGLYYLRRPPVGGTVLSLFAPADATSTDVTTLPPDFEGWGFDLSPDQSRLLFSEMLTRESDLRIATPRG